MGDITKDQSDGAALVAIPGDMTIYQAADLKSLLLSALAHEGTLAIDLAATNEIDTAGVQLLLALKKAVQQGNRNMRIENAGPEVTMSIELLGLGRLFGITEVEGDHHES